MNTSKQEKETESLLGASRTGKGARDTESNSTSSAKNKRDRETSKKKRERKLPWSEYNKQGSERDSIVGWSNTRESRVDSR